MSLFGEHFQKIYMIRISYEQLLGEKNEFILMISHTFLVINILKINGFNYYNYTGLNTNMFVFNF